MARWADWLGAGSAVVGVAIAALVAWQGLRAFLHQRTTNDVALALSLFAEINRYWDRISSREGDAEYNYGQILAYFEVACALFNRQILTTAANSILSDHIVEVFSILQTSEGGKEILRRCRSADSTFSEIEKFGKLKFPQALRAVAFAEAREP
jgi:hypothetical protein